MELIDLAELKKLSLNFKAERMPSLFLGHGSPMNAIEENQFNKTWRKVAAELPKPKAILVISAHWLTRGTAVAITPKPETIHDFRGFPDALFKVQYPAKGSPEWAKETAKSIQLTTAKEDHEWGLDHGAWSVLMHTHPNADVPVFQLSIDFYKTPHYHYNIGKELADLQKKGVMIVGSGNVVHNLRMLNFKGEKYDWAQEFDNIVAQSIKSKTDTKLLNTEKLGGIFAQAHPTPDHYYPLLYLLGLNAENKQEALQFNNSMDMGSVSMRSFVWA